MENNFIYQLLMSSLEGQLILKYYKYDLDNHPVQGNELFRPKHVARIVILNEFKNKDYE